MDYFFGIHFLHGGHAPFDKNFFTRNFEGYYGIQYNHSGNFIYGRGEDSAKVYSGAMAFITYPGITFCYGALAGEHRDHSYVCFKGPRVDDFIDRGLMTLPTDPQRIDNPDMFLETLLRCNEYFTRGGGFEDRAVLLLEDLLLRIHESRFRHANMPRRFGVALETLIGNIRRRPQLGWDFIIEARKMNVSYAHFRRIFHEYLHVAPQAFVIRCRMELAAELLRESDEPVSVVAERCGVGQLHYFSRLFKKRFRLSPSAYRREFGGTQH